MSNKWDQWIESEEGKGALEPSIIKPGSEQFLHNRLWRAFHAGNFTIEGKLETKAESLLKRVISNPKAYCSIRLKREIKLYLEQIKTRPG